VAHVFLRYLRIEWVIGEKCKGGTINNGLDLKFKFRKILKKFKSLKKLGLNLSDLNSD
jgi:hypothetical protein